MQSTLRAFLTLVVLCWIGVSVPTASMARQDIPQTSVINAADNVQAVIARANDLAARIKAHRFAATYYDEPCQPTKQEGEASLSQYRRELRALRALAETLESDIRQLEVNSGNKLILGEHGWDFQNLKRFRPLQAAVQNAFAALAAQEAKLDAMVAKPCPKAQPPKKPVTDGPLTPQEEGELDDFPLPVPVFDDPVVLPTPPKFCTFAERRAWMDTVYWPTAERAKQNAVKAIETFGRAEQRLRDVISADREGSPRIALAQRSVDYWRKEKDRRIAAQRKILDTDIPNPVDCEKPRTTTGGTAGPVTTPQPAPPPATDGPVTPPTPLPPGITRPQLERVNIPSLPKDFCSESQKQAFLVDVYHPAAEAASKNALKTSAYRKLLADRIYDATMSGDAAVAAALKREYEAWKPIAEEADALQQRMLRMRDEILRIPVVDCTKPGRPPVTPPPVTPPPPITDGPVTPPPPKPKLPPPALSRPQFERAPEITVPVKFCSEFERNDFLTNIYNPAVAAALGNARAAQEHQAKLNAMFTQYMQANSEYWGAVRAERDAWEPIAAAATAKAETLRQLYAKIMAVPVVPCEQPKTPPPPPPTPPITDGPDDGPTDGPSGRTELDGVIFPRIDLPPVPKDFCQGERQAADDNVERAMKTVEDNEQRVREYRRELEEEMRYYKGHPNKRLMDNVRFRLDALKGIEARIAEDRAAVEAYREAIKTVPDYCPPREGPGVSPPPPPEPRVFELPPRPVDPCDAAQRQAYRRALIDLYDRVAETADALEDYLYLGVGPMMVFGPTRTALTQQLDAYDELLDTIEDRLDEVAFGKLNLLDYCPPPPLEERVPCPPKEGREPITVGSNAQTGSGAQFRSKAAGLVTSTLLGALGGGGGGGGGSDGPDLWTCKIKDSEYTVFDDPATGVSLKVGAKRGKGGKVVIFSEIAKSPDKGTFQTAFLENPTTGETQAPNDVGPCDLWGEWKLTVSWTKTTYVNGQMVDRQSGGWSKTGKFSIPGALSKADAPDGLWKRMGFSNASNGAREMGMIFDVAPGGGPLTFVIHVTRPKGDPVTTVPFVLTMTEGPNGFTFTRAEDPPCPEEEEVQEEEQQEEEATGPRPTELVRKPGGGFYIPGTDVFLPSPPSGPTFDTAPADYAPPAATTTEEPQPPAPRTVLDGPRKPGELDREARMLVDRWRADDAENVAKLFEGNCDPSLRKKLLDAVEYRRTASNTGYGPLWKDILERALKLDGERLKALEGMLESDPQSQACPAVPQVVGDPPPLPAPTFDGAPADYTPPPDSPPDNDPM